MTIDKPTYQLKLPLDLPEEEAGNSPLSVEEVRVRAETARAQLEGGKLWPVSEKGEVGSGKGGAPDWFEEYLKLVGGGWPWRVAVYIAWLAQPKPRWPKSQHELATQVLGLTSDRQFSIWRAKNPAIDAMVEQARFGMVYDALGDIFAASISVASSHDYKGHHDRAMLYKMVGYLSDKIEADINNSGVDLAKLSFEEKLRLAKIDNAEEIIALRAKLAKRREEYSFEEEGEEEEKEETKEEEDVAERGDDGQS